MMSCWAERPNADDVPLALTNCHFGLADGYDVAFLELDWCIVSDLEAIVTVHA